MFIVYTSHLDLIYRKITERITADEVKLKREHIKLICFVSLWPERWIPICCLLDQLAKFSKFYFDTCCTLKSHNPAVAIVSCAVWIMLYILQLLS